MVERRFHIGHFVACMVKGDSTSKKSIEAGFGGQRLQELDSQAADKHESNFHLLQWILEFVGLSLRAVCRLVEPRSLFDIGNRHANVMKRSKMFNDCVQSGVPSGRGLRLR